MGHIAEENVDHGEEKTAPESKQDQADKRYQQIKPCPIERKPEHNEEQNQWNHREKKIDQVGNNSG